MRRKIFTIIILIVTIINILLGSIIIFNIQILETPEITIDIELSILDTEKAVLKTIIDVNNTNDFEIIMKNIKIITTNLEGYEVAQLYIKGGAISPNNNKTYKRDIIISFNEHNSKVLTSKITGEVGANFFFIQKTLPIKLGVVTNFEKIINELSAPIFNINVDFDKIEKEGIKLISKINVYNPNSFDLYIKNISTIIESEKKETMGNLKIFYKKIPAKKTTQLNCSGMVLFKALDAKTLTLNLSGYAGAKIAGFDKNVSFYVKSFINIPDLDKLFLSEEKPTFLSIKFDEKFTLQGVIIYVGLEINNTYKVDLEARDLVFKVYTVKGEAYNLIGKNDVIEKINAKSGKTGITTTDIFISYKRLLSIDWSTDWIMASVTGRVGIKGVNQSALLEIRGYQSLHPFK